LWLFLRKKLEQKIIDRKRPTVIEIGWLDKKEKRYIEKYLGKRDMSTELETKSSLCIKK